VKSGSVNHTLRPSTNFYPHFPYSLTDLGKIRYSRSPSNMVDKMRVSWKSTSRKSRFAQFYPFFPHLPVSVTFDVTAQHITAPGISEFREDRTSILKVKNATQRAVRKFARHYFAERGMSKGHNATHYYNVALKPTSSIPENTKMHHIYSQYAVTRTHCQCHLCCITVCSSFLLQSGHPKYWQQPDSAQNQLLSLCSRHTRTMS
jgi:hypothetical protein